MSKLHWATWREEMIYGKETCGVHPRLVVAHLLCDKQNEFLWVCMDIRFMCLHCLQGFALPAESFGKDFLKRILGWRRRVSSICGGDSTSDASASSSVASACSSSSLSSSSVSPCCVGEWCIGRPSVGGRWVDELCVGDRCVWGFWVGGALCRQALVWWELRLQAIWRWRWLAIVNFHIHTFTVFGHP